MTILPIGAPSRAELWSRIRLARAVLAQRQPTQQTIQVVLHVLDGEPIESLLRRMTETG